MKDLEYTNLVCKWIQDNRGVSNSSQIISHPDFQRIISKGEKIFPLFFKYADEFGAGIYYTIITAILYDKVQIPASVQGKPNEIAKFWKSWGEQNHYYQAVQKV